MSFLGTNKYNDSWAQRQQGGFSRYSRNPQPRQVEESEEVRKAVDGLTFSRPGSSLQSTRPGPPNYKNRTSAAGAEKPLEEVKQPLVPRYVETEKQVLRFYCHFFDEPADVGHHRGRMKAVPKRPRLFTLFIFIEDFTVEIIEDKVPNSGVQGGVFYRRNALKRRDGSNFSVDDFGIKRRITALGHDFFITDCDDFTREYYRRHFGIVQGDALPRPVVESAAAELPKGAIAAANAPMEGDNVDPESTTMSARASGMKSADYASRREQLDKTHKYLHSDDRVLRFKCLELQDSKGRSMLDHMTGGASTFLCLSYFMVDDCVDVRVVRSSRVSHDDPTAILKKSRLPKNWRQASTGGMQEYYSYTDLVCGSTIDCFGRKIFISGCDEPTREFYASLGITQREVVLENTRDRQVDQQVPVHGEGGLAIGSSDDSLRTVFSKSRVHQTLTPDKFAGQTLRCKCKFANARGADTERRFLLTYYMEDNTLGVFEDVVKNSGFPGGNFLRRGIYQNGLPPEGGGARRFWANDVFLGNRIILNGSEMEIYQMDDASVKFCEENWEEFPLFDPYEVVRKLLDKVIKNRTDVRAVMSIDRDVDRKGWFTQDELMDCLEVDLDMFSSLNDQELMTLMRVCKEEAKPDRPPRYFYHELCDLFSYCHYKAQVGAKKKGKIEALDLLLDDLRGRQTRWRRELRLHPKCLSGCITLEDLTACLSTNGFRFTLPNQRTIVANYSLPDAEARAILQIMNPDKPTQSSSVRGRGRGSGAINSTRSGGFDPNKELDVAGIVIDVHSLCNEIYLCDWA